MRTFFISTGITALSLLSATSFFGAFSVPGVLLSRGQVASSTIRTSMFDMQVIDTMKESRDRSAAALDDLTAYQVVVDAQLKQIKDAGATYVALGTPYDAQFLPVLRLWVDSARAHNLKVWFRGNFSGWEGWFEYPKTITRLEHEGLLLAFLRANSDLFQNGDIFTPCPECENGGPGNPFTTGDIAGFNNFLVEEKNIADNEFTFAGKKVLVYNSMNADVARYVLDRPTIALLGGTILIDHYVMTPQQFAADIETIPSQIGARIGLGEFGAPIPDLQGLLTDEQQGQYVNALFLALYKNSVSIPLVSYWTLTQGSTALVNDAGDTRSAYDVVKTFYKAPSVYGGVINTLGDPLDGAKISVADTDAVFMTKIGWYQVFLPGQYKTFTVSAPGYISQTFTLTATSSVSEKDFELTPTNPTLLYRFRATTGRSLFDVGLGVESREAFPVWITWLTIFLLVSFASVSGMGARRWYRKRKYGPSGWARQSDKEKYFEEHENSR